MYGLLITLVAYQQTHVNTRGQLLNPQRSPGNFHYHTSKIRRKIEKTNDRETEKSSADSRMTKKTLRKIRT